MEDGSFWTNFLGQFKDFNDWIKAVIIIAPCAGIAITIIKCFSLYLRYKEKRIAIEKQVTEEHLKHNQLKLADQLILNALKRIKDYRLQADNILQIEPPDQKRETTKAPKAEK